MKINQFRKSLIALAVALPLVVTGCILSGQFIIVWELNKNIQSDDANIDYAYVDLTTDDTWEDHHDNIQGIEDIKFEARFTNNESDTASGEVWISTELVSTVDETTATRVFSGLKIPGNDFVDVSFSESGSYIENLDVVLDLLEGGKFYVYGIAAGTPFDVTISGVDGNSFCRIMVTLSAGP